MIFLVYCIASLFYYVFVLFPASTWYIILLLWCDIAYLCWKCRYTPSKQTNNKRSVTIPAIITKMDNLLFLHLCNILTRKMEPCSRRKIRSTILTKQSLKCGSDWRKLPSRSYLRRSANLLTSKLHRSHHFI